MSSEWETPSTKHLVLKPKEITPTEVPSRTGDGTAISVQLIHEQNRIAEIRAEHRIKTGEPFPGSPAQESVPAGFKQKEIEKLNAVAKADDEEAIHVHGILSENHQAELRTGWKRIYFRKRRASRRLRDFLILVGSIDLALAWTVKTFHDAITFVYGISAMTLVTVFTGFILFFVMDDY